MSFAQLFKKFRLKSEFSTLSSFGDALSESGIVLENSTFSHWQRGKRTPTNRRLIIKIIHLFAQKGGIQSLKEANILLETTGNGFLTDEEKINLFKNEQLFNGTTFFINNDTKTEFTYSSELSSIDLKEISNSNNLVDKLQNQIFIQHEKIYEGYPGIAYINLYKIYQLIHKLGLKNKRTKSELLSQIRWMKIRCLSDLTESSDFSYALQESQNALLFIQENKSIHLGQAYWVNSAIQRLSLITQNNEIFISDIQDCLQLAQLAIKHTPKIFKAELLHSNLEIAKIALLLENNKLFEKHMEESFLMLNKMSINQKHFGAMIWDVKARGILRFRQNINHAITAIKKAKQYSKPKYQAINLYLKNTQLQVLLTSPEKKHNIEATPLKSNITLEANILGNPYQAMRNSNQFRFRGL